MTSLFALAATLPACDQPPPKCGVPRGAFAAKYTLVPGTKVGEGDCDTLVGDVLGVQAYTAKKEGSDYPDPNKVSMGIQPSAITGALARAQQCGMDNISGETAYALGAFKSYKVGNDDFCEVPTFTGGHLKLPDLDSCQADMCHAPDPAQPAVEYNYQWSNVRVYVTPGATGNQFSARLKYTQDGCSAEYDVWAVYPAVSCAAPAASGMNPATEPDAGETSDDAGLGGMDASIDLDGGVEADGGDESDSGEFVKPDGCDPDPEPVDYVPSEFLCSQEAPLIDSLTPSGSQLNPEFMVQCDPVLMHCVLSNPPPSLR